MVSRGWHFPCLPFARPWVQPQALAQAPVPEAGSLDFFFFMLFLVTPASGTPGQQWMCTRRGRLPPVLRRVTRQGMTSLLVTEPICPVTATEPSWVLSARCRTYGHVARWLSSGSLLPEFWRKQAEAVRRRNEISRTPGGTQVGVSGKLGTALSRVPSFTGVPWEQFCVVTVT